MHAVPPCLCGLCYLLACHLVASFCGSGPWHYGVLAPTNLQGSDNLDHWRVNLTFDPVLFEDPALGVKVGGREPAAGQVLRARRAVPRTLLQRRSTHRPSSVGCAPQCPVGLNSSAPYQYREGITPNPDPYPPTLPFLPVVTAAGAPRRVRDGCCAVRPLPAAGAGPPGHLALCKGAQLAGRQAAKQAGTPGCSRAAMWSVRRRAEECALPPARHLLHPSSAGTAAGS